MQEKLLSGVTTPTKEMPPINLEQRENLLEFLKVIFSEDVTDYGDYAHSDEISFI